VSLNDISVFAAVIKSPFGDLYLIVIVYALATECAVVAYYCNVIVLVERSVGTVIRVLREPSVGRTT
jgi:hypothetical protein